MDIKFDQNLIIEQSQQLVMTPAMIQAIQILQFSGQELEDFVQKQLEANPALERSDKWQAPSTELDTYNLFSTTEESLTEHLLFQLEVSVKSKSHEQIGQYIIESIDENGYLTLPVDDIITATGAAKDEVIHVLRLIQSFEPYGVGARNITECLLIQLHYAGLLTQDFKKLLHLHLHDLTANRMKVISKSMGISLHQLQEMTDILKKLDPKPGLQFSGSREESKYITPEIFVVEEDGRYIVKVNEDNDPQLVVSSYHQQLLSQSKDDPEVHRYLKDRINSAMWLINSIQQRRKTIYNIASAIVEHQQEFFRHGSKHIKTMTLRQIAEEANVHESTVSRTVNGKYLQCRDGVFELKYFFTSGAADGTSSRSIKAHIAEILRSEDPHHPLSDQKISDLIKQKGISISRRTVAKYREEMGIASSPKRKRY